MMPCGSHRNSAALWVLYTLVTAGTATHSCCPTYCKGEPSSWAAFDTVDSLKFCDRQLMLDISSQDLLNAASTSVKVRACTVFDDEDSSSEGMNRLQKRNGTLNLCMTSASPISASIEVGLSGNGSDFTDVTVSTLAQISRYLSKSCELKKVFSYTTGAIIGVFSGEAVDNGGSIPALLAEAIALTNGTNGAPQTMYIQRCVQEGNSEHILGVALDNSGNLPWVESVVKSWSNGTCLNATASLTGNYSIPEVSNITMCEYSHPAVILPNITSGNTASSSSSISGSGIPSTSSFVPPETSSSTESSTSSGSTLSSTPTSFSSVTSGPTTATAQSAGTAVYTTPPGPTQTGIASNCDAFAEPEAGQGCYDFAAAYGITLDELYAWNPAIGSCEK